MHAREDKKSLLHLKINKSHNIKIEHLAPQKYCFDLKGLENNRRSSTVACYSMTNGRYGNMTVSIF